MRKAFYFILFSALFFAFIFFWSQKKTTNSRLQKTSFSPSNPFKSLTLEKSLFVPYWALDNTSETSEFNEVIYFGIEGSKDGINTNDLGYRNIKVFSNNFKDKKKVLTIRLLNNQDNLEILKNKKIQNQIIDETISVAKENGFDGIMLDLEISALPFSSLVNRITSFSSDFYTKSKENKLSYSIAIYGDNYYRVRPFEPKDLAKKADKIYVMAYDLHKAGGDSGPTFPFEGLDTFGYDFKSMIADFSKDVPSEKLAIIYGLFGYDWMVNEKNESIDTGTAVTFAEAKNKFLDNCLLAECKVEKDKDSGAIKISYLEGNQKHIVWVEDLSFINTKTDYLLQKGINKISFWANSFF